MQRSDVLSQNANGPPTGSCSLDHDGCVVCSDAGIPVRVVSLDGDDALCEDASSNRASIAIELVAPVAVDDVLLTHGGVAIGRGVAEDLTLVTEKNGYEVRQ